MAESSNYMQPSIPRFDGFYDHWVMLMENLLRSKEFWDLIENGVTVAPANATHEQLKAAEDSRLKDLKAKNYLFQAIDRTILETILSKDTAKEIWDSMRQKYQGSSKVKRAQLQALRKEYETLNMKIGESIEDYFCRTLTIANKMKMHGEIMTQGDIDDRRSTSGYVFMIASSVCQGIWLSRILAQIDSRESRCITIYCDNSSSIKLSKNPVMHGRSKHIDVRFHFLRDLTKEGVVQLIHCSSFEQVADIMTKALSFESFSRNRDKLARVSLACKATELQALCARVCLGLACSFTD
ncbi:retrovirus-related Pol polyprotein from transposon TNT 1-94 [Trifolium pratense]|uniref:Retrovirus-related Pol polyprotein from transposon TNT 1-94 n=1 Tax=Trifolium pratense TaxID=57577 RepID=A0A2K3ND08_TRIPR|nr:retrovirus-related Pol polyprotein from transposon TNT 1-94 [Trifolium pratense]